MKIVRDITTLVLFILLESVISINAGPSSTATPGTGMHPSWDLDGDTVNDCELDGTCDHTIDYSRPRASPTIPSFDCKTAGLNSSETLVCTDPQLSVLDRKMHQVFKAAQIKGKANLQSTLKSEQRGWIKGRDDCWKADDQRQCVYDSYLLRIAELQARYRLVPSVGPIQYICGKSKASEVVITYFRTIPPTLIAEWGDSVSLMYDQSDRSPGRYQGRNESLIIDGSAVTLRWGDQQPAIRCKESLRGSRNGPTD